MEHRVLSSKLAIGVSLVIFVGMLGYAYNIKSNETRKEHDFKLLIEALDESSDLIAVGTADSCLYRNKALIKATGITADDINKHGGPIWNKLTSGQYANYIKIINENGIYEDDERIRSSTNPDGILVHAHAVKLNSTDIIQIYRKLE